MALLDLLISAWKCVRRALAREFTTDKDFRARLGRAWLGTGWPMRC